MNNIDKTIAELLQNYPIIWDRSRKDFREINKKENAFKDLAGPLHLSGKY